MRPRTALNLAVLGGMLAAGGASAVELRDAELLAGASPVLQNDTGTVFLEDARLGRIGPLIFVPEPGALWQLGSGVGLLALLAARRRRTAPHSQPAERPRSANLATPSRRMP